ncbi:MAG: WbqC family protein [Deltaproteobacteria bacterium]|nr:WbqC family protein [Deltaproteobacteria bacterium]
MPYLGFFHRFLFSDLWVVLDNVQFVASSRSWHNRDKLKTKDGAKWFTVSVEKCPRETMIKDVRLSADVDWRGDNLNLIEFNYRKAPFFDEIFPYVKSLYGFKCSRLVDFNLKSIEMLMGLFGIKIDSAFASALGAAGKKNGLLIDILKKTGATDYLSGAGARDYLEPALFEAAGINVVWQEFSHPVYPQLYGEFIPYLSSIDLLFNCGIEKSRVILRSIA